MCLAVIGPAAVCRCYAQRFRARFDRQIAFGLRYSVVLGKRAFFKCIAERVLYRARCRDRAGEAVGRTFAPYPAGLDCQSVFVLAFYFFIRKRASIVLSRLASGGQRYRCLVDAQRSYIGCYITVAARVAYCICIGVVLAVARVVVFYACRRRCDRYLVSGAQREDLACRIRRSCCSVIRYSVDFVGMCLSVVGPALRRGCNHKCLAARRYRQRSVDVCNVIVRSYIRVAILDNRAACYVGLSSYFRDRSAYSYALYCVCSLKAFRCRVIPAVICQRRAVIFLARAIRRDLQR